MKSVLAYDGLNDWVHLSERLKEHEKSVEHIISMNSWYELRTRLSKDQIIDKEMQELIKKEKKLLDEIDIDTIITDFASRTVRRNCFNFFLNERAQIVCISINREG